MTSISRSIGATPSTLLYEVELRHGLEAGPVSEATAGEFIEVREFMRKEASDALGLAQAKMSVLFPGQIFKSTSPNDSKGFRKRTKESTTEYSLPPLIQKETSVLVI